VLDRITRRIEEKQGITISGGSTAPATLTPIPSPGSDAVAPDEAMAAAPVEDAVAAAE
jgi:hypothetical protein